MAVQVVDGLFRAGVVLNGILRKLCAALLGAMVLIVWFGVLSRYVLELGITWTEELARYVMIWAALLAVPVGVFQRAHIGFELLFLSLPRRAQKGLRVLLDLMAIGFFGFLAWYGVGMTAAGAQQYATIFGMTMLVPFASVPVSATLAAFQTLVVLLRDIADAQGEPPGAEVAP